MIGVGLTFFMALALWGVVRSQIVLTETHRRLFWVGTVALVVGPALSPYSTHDLVNNVIWPLAAGLMASEMLWQRYAAKVPFLKPQAPEPEPIKRKRRKRKKPPEG